MSSRIVLSRLVAAALISENRVLLARRTPNKRWYGNLWDLPGGHVESEETEKQAIVREVGEELGVLITEPVGPPLDRLAEFISSGAKVADLSIWVVTDWIGEIVNNSPREHCELGWFTRRELPTLKLAHPEYVTILGKIIGSPEDQPR